MDQSIESKESDYLFIEESNISGAGLGLFTAINIFKDEIISIFKGEVLSQKQAKIRVLKKEDRYFMNLPNGSIFDTSQTDCFAKYANDASGFQNQILPTMPLLNLKMPIKFVWLPKGKSKQVKRFFVPMDKNIGINTSRISFLFG